MRPNTLRRAHVARDMSRPPPLARNQPVTRPPHPAARTHPSMQPRTAITDHAVPVGSGTVARTQRIPIERRAEAANPDDHSGGIAQQPPPCESQQLVDATAMNSR